jgi:hypothetical protein
MAYGMLAPSGRAKNFVLRLQDELGIGQESDEK